MPAANALDDQKTAGKKYEVLRARVLAGDLTVNWREFRIAAKVARVDRSYNYVSANDRATQDFRDGKYSDGLAEGLAMEGENLANPLGHVIVFSAYKYLGKQVAADREQAICQAIMASITSSGDGHSIDTAYFTVSPVEDHLLLQMTLGLQSKQQSLVQKEGHYFDRIVAVDATGAETVVWFNTDIDMQMMLADAPPDDSAPTK